MSEMKTTVLEKLQAEPKNWWKRVLVLLVLIALMVWSSNQVHYNGVTLKGPTIAVSIIKGIFNPNPELFIWTDTGIPYLILETISIAVLGTIIGAVIAIPVSFLASTNMVPRPVAYLFRALILLIRTIPSLVWALIWIRVTGPGAFCGVVTQGICSIGMISKMYITAIEDLNTGILESLDAAGCSTFEKIRYGVLPQLSAAFISTAIYRFDINLKDATTLGIVGAGGIGFPLLASISAANWENVGSFLLTLILLVVIIEYFSTKVRARLAHGRR